MIAMKKIFQKTILCFLMTSMVAHAHDQVIMHITPASLQEAYENYAAHVDQHWYAKTTFQGLQLLFMSCVVLSFASYGHAYMMGIDEEKKNREHEKYTKYQMMSAIIAGNKRYQSFEESQKESKFFEWYQDRLLEVNRFVTGFGIALVGSIGGTLLADYFESNIKTFEYEDTLEGFIRSHTNIHGAYVYFTNKSDLQEMPTEILISKLNDLVADIHRLLVSIIYQLKNRSDIAHIEVLEKLVDSSIVSMNEKIITIGHYFEIQQDLVTEKDQQELCYQIGALCEQVNDFAEDAVFFIA
jgi:hypothetical protein